MPLTLISASSAVTLRITLVRCNLLLVCVCARVWVVVCVCIRADCAPGVWSYDEVFCAADMPRLLNLG